jgi:hypothetical protein
MVADSVKVPECSFFSFSATLCNQVPNLNNDNTRRGPGDNDAIVYLSEIVGWQPLTSTACLIMLEMCLPVDIPQLLSLTVPYHFEVWHVRAVPLTDMKGPDHPLRMVRPSEQDERGEGGLGELKGTSTRSRLHCSCRQA